MYKFLIAVLLLTALQGSALAEGRRLMIVTLEFAPYISAALPNNGWAWEVAETALRSQGYTPELRILPWARAVKLTQLGEVDALYMANDNPARREWAVFSDSIGEEYSVAFKLRARDLTFSQLSDLEPYRIIGLRGAHVVQKLRNAGLAIEEVSELAQGIRQVYFSRADFLVTDRYVASYIIATQMPADYGAKIDFIPRPLDINYLHLAVSKRVPDHEAVRDDFNRGLALIREDGTYQRILGQHGF